jgi:hypothetical protein
MGQRFEGLAGATMLATLVAGAVLADDNSSFVHLFDGQTLDGWTGEHTHRYSIRDGAIVSNGGTGWLRYKKSFKDFELRAEYRADQNDADSGLLFRASTQSKPKEPYGPARGYQLQVMDPRNSFAILGFGVPPPRFNRKSGALKEAMNAPGRWQTVTLRVIGNHAEATLNGTTITVSESIELREGSIGLRSENHPVEWRNLKIRELSAP